VTEIAPPTSSFKPSELPAFYDPSRVGTLYPPDVGAAAAAGRRAGLSPAASDRRRVALFLVDAQIDFIHPPPVGSLSVPGAVDDTRRTTEFLYRNAGRISTVVASLDSHVPHQIFYASWWSDEAGRPPAPFTLIDAADVEAGRWRPRREPAWSLAYVRGLAATSKKALCVWPYHTMVGSPGHALDPALFEALTFHAAARDAEPRFVAKGSVPETEHYSVFEPEIAYGAAAEARRNDALLEELARFDLVLVAGQAKSHCVLESVRSLIDHLARRPEPGAEVCLLSDCTSSVAHPEVDFEALARVEYEALEARGLRVRASTDPATLGA
jgi:nicotinamidase-related amidase